MPVVSVEGGDVLDHAKERRMRQASSLLAVALVLLVGCSRSTAGSASSPPVKTSTASEPLTFVALGDSWPEGAHCGYCKTFAGRYADGLKTLTGRPVEFTDLTGDGQPFLPDGRRRDREPPACAPRGIGVRRPGGVGRRDHDRDGPNEGDRAFGPYAEGHCGQGFACVKRLERFWIRNFDAILDDIESLRGDQPTAIRLVSAANFFVSDPSATKGLPADAMAFGAAYFEALNTSECDAAQTHDAICVDVRPVLNGPTLDQPVDENSPASMQAVAEALLATGLPELGR